ncbi:alkaline phosphatase family protein [Haloglomus litoreum]|uniref:alkaline phosphatase family protein n=1 Tax=Haloglomus litoreum TaxID=3034026 RepID=UPI0023E853AC|nr:alkaline phosphatase family protein [Haloglomus sp. DT116]
MNEEHAETAVSERTRAFVLGLDGVPWNLLERWASAGELPNFGRLLTEGAAGPLESTTPATTALAWPSLATGVRPDRHGSYGFRRLQPDYTHRMTTSDDITATPLWERLSPAVVANVPMTYPAQPIDGELVSGMMTPRLDERATHPSSLAETVRETVPDYRIGLDWNEYADRPDDLVSDLEAAVGARRELMRLLMEREDWRLFFFVYTAPDRLQHLVWDEDRILEHYRLLDEILGEVLAYVERHDATLFVVSDHGFGPVETIVNVNTALERAGYLTATEPSGARGALARLGIGKASVRDTLERLGLDESAVLRRLPTTLVERVASTVPGDHVLFDVDYGETLAFCYGAGLVYVNDTERFAEGTVPPEDRTRIRDEVAAVLRSLRDPATGDPVVQVHEGSALFPTDERAPDLVVRGAGDYHIGTSLTETVYTAPESLNATHRSEGIALVWGPSIQPGTRLADATVYDLAPTLLHTVGEPVPADTDGRVWTEAFEPGSDPVSRAVELGPPADASEEPGSRDDPDADGPEPTDDEEAAAVEDRLRGLGYLD